MSRPYSFNRTFMKKLLIIGLILGWLIPGYCEEKQSFSPEVKDICNKIVISIYNDLLKTKENYPPLKNLNEKFLYTNPGGIYTIFYQNADQATKKNYSFGLTFSSLEDQIFQDQPGYFVQEFPFLNAKLAGFVQKNPSMANFDIFGIVNLYIGLLADYQQAYLPLKLSLVSLKKSFKVNEPVEFEVILENVAKQQFLVKSFGTKTLFFLFNNRTWATQQLGTKNQNVKGGERIVLIPGQALQMQFKGESFAAPKEFEIYCVYQMAVKGVQPSAKLKIKVEK